MTINETTGEITETDEYRVEKYAHAKEELKNMQDYVGRMELDLIQTAAERAATTIFGKDHNFVVSRPNEYDRPALAGLREIFSPAEWEQCEETKVTVKINMVKVNKIARSRGKEAISIIEAARFDGKVSGKLEETGK